MKLFKEEMKFTFECRYSMAEAMSNAKSQTIVQETVSVLLVKKCFKFPPLKYSVARHQPLLVRQAPISCGD